MKYIIFDLEFNSPFKIDRKTKQLKKGNTVTMCPQEIIEIGAVKVNANFEIEDTFQMFVKPQLYTKIHPKVKSKTGITIKDLEKGESILNTIETFREWISDEDFMLCSWGKDDINELIRNCKYFDINTEWITKFYDIQRSCMKHLNLPMSQQLGLKNAILQFNIEIDSKFHKALNDAIYTAKIFKEIDINNTLD